MAYTFQMVLMVLLIASAGFAQEAKSGWEEYELKGKVKRCLRTHYSLEVQGEEIIKKLRHPILGYNLIFEVNFDEEGRITSTRRFHNKDTLISLVTFHYQNDRKFKTTFYPMPEYQEYLLHGGASVLETKSYSLYRYDEDNRLIRVDSYNAINDAYTDGLTHTYDERGNILTTTILGYNEKPQVKYTYTYYTNDLLASERLSIAGVYSGGYIPYYRENRYDLEGREILNAYFQQDTVIRETRTRYETRDSLEIEIVVSKDHGYVTSYSPYREIPEISTTRREFKFDAHGNWIELMIYIDDVPNAQVIRELTYYED